MGIRKEKPKKENILDKVLHGRLSFIVRQMWDNWFPLILRIEEHDIKTKMVSLSLLYKLQDIIHMS